LAYADDLVLFINDIAEWETAKNLLQLYGQASNARINLSKTIMISMTGRHHQQWTDITMTSGIT
ncbi:hypothetical protein BC941DRAFT_330164, partial [Chlamydoabsidia padenii]